MDVNELMFCCQVSVELYSFEVLVDTVSSKRFHNQIEGQMIHVLVPLGTASSQSACTTLCESID